MFFIDRLTAIYKENLRWWGNIWEDALAIRRVHHLNLFCVRRSSEKKDSVSVFLQDLQNRAISDRSFRFLLMAYDFHIDDEELDIYWPNMALVHATRYGRVCTGLSRSRNTMISVTPISEDVVIVIYSDQEGACPQKDPIAAARTLTDDELIAYRKTKYIRDIPLMYYSFRSSNE